MRKNSFFVSGFRSMLPITIGVIPFGAVMGTVSADAGLSFSQSFFMNFIVYAGASQLAAIDLMKNGAASTVVVATGLIINMRFLLYSAAMSPVVQKSKLATKLFCAFNLTDQSYATMSAHQHQFRSSQDAIQFYIGTAVCMSIVWHLSVSAGFVFGNFAPASLSLDYAIPLSFIALVVPTLKNKKYVLVAAFSALIAVPLDFLPYKTGLIVTALLSMGLAILLTKPKASS